MEAQQRDQLALPVFLPVPRHTRARRACRRRNTVDNRDRVEKSALEVSKAVDQIGIRRTRTRRCSARPDPSTAAAASLSISRPSRDRLVSVSFHLESRARRLAVAVPVAALLASLS